jgi:hypothetical protein
MLQENAEAVGQARACAGAGFQPGIALLTIIPQCTVLQSTASMRHLLVPTLAGNFECSVRVSDGNFIVTADVPRRSWKSQRQRRCSWQIRTARTSVARCLSLAVPAHRDGAKQHWRNHAFDAFCTRPPHPAIRPMLCLCRCILPPAHSLPPCCDTPPVALDCVHCGKVGHAVTEHAVARPSEWCDACTALPLLRTWLHVVDWCRWGVQVPRMHRSAMASRS